MSKPAITLDKKVRQRLAYVFLLPEVGAPIKRRAKKLLLRAELLRKELASLDADIDVFEAEDIREWWKRGEVSIAKRDSRTRGGFA